MQKKYAFKDNGHGIVYLFVPEISYPCGFYYHEPVEDKYAASSYIYPEGHGTATNRLAGIFDTENDARRFLLAMFVVNALKFYPEVLSADNNNEFVPHFTWENGEWKNTTNP